MLIERDHGLGCQAPAMRYIDRRRRCGGQLVDVIEKWNEHLGRRYRALGNALRQTGERRFFAVYQEHAAPNRLPRRDPARELGAVGVTRIVVDAADARRDLDLLALDAPALAFERSYAPEEFDRVLAMNSTLPRLWSRSRRSPGRPKTPLIRVFCQQLWF